MEYLAENSKDSVVSLSDPSFSNAITRWQKQHGRHNLPWQGTRDAYNIWLSEIMLQQTQVTTVVSYYQRFLVSFPNIWLLAAAPTEEVMAHWSGLGYYARARNLHHCAQRIVAEYSGIFPDDPMVLKNLPGIGRSTAAAIAVFSYGIRAAILDGNVKRVFARTFGINFYPGLKTIEDAMWLRATALLPLQDVESYTQGLMDLGSKICIPRKPQCHLCPISQRCVALNSSRTSELPVRKPKKNLLQKSICMLMITDQYQVILEQRPNHGIWGGLLSLPEICPGKNFDARLDTAVSAFGSIELCQPLKPFMHVFTHIKLCVSPFQVFLRKRHNSVIHEKYCWYSIDKLPDAPLPAPVKKILMGVLFEKNLFS